MCRPFLNLTTLPKDDDAVNKRLLTRVIAFSLASLHLVACSASQLTSTPTDTPIPEPIATPALIPTETATEWLHVALGDSEARCCGVRSYPEYYDEFIEQDLNVKVNLRNLSVGDQTTGELLLMLEDEDIRNLISEAQVVTLVIMMDDIYSCRVGDKDCVDEKLTTAKANYTAIIEEILALTSPEETIIRTQTFDNPFVNKWKEQGDFEERKPTIDRLNRQIIDIATLYNIPVARVYLDFNGPNGDQDPGEKGYISGDGMHNSDAGVRRMAELLRGLGYAPLAP
jgi:lysophospholipase L1-like esterase